MRADHLRRVTPGFRRKPRSKRWRCGKYIRCAQRPERPFAAVDQQIEVQQQAFGALFIEEQIVDVNDRLAVKPAAQNVIAGMAIFGLVPVQHAAELAAIVAELLTGGALALIDAEALGIGIVADMAGMDDDQVLAMMGMRPVPVGGDLAADLAVVERKGPEMLGDQDDRITLAFVGAKCRATASCDRAGIRATGSNCIAAARTGCNAWRGRQGR